jgi:hypothetical protein
MFWSEVTFWTFWLCFGIALAFVLDKEILTKPDQSYFVQYIDADHIHSLGPMTKDDCSTTLNRIINIPGVEKSHIFCVP